MSDDTNPKDRLGSKKPDLSLVPPASLIHEATAMENGATKYGPYNWREKKVRARVYVAAALRHLSEYLDGADYSSDTSPPVHHLAHAKACCGILLDAIETGNLVDDRPAKGAASRLLAPRVGVAPTAPFSPYPRDDEIREALDTMAARRVREIM